MTLSFEGMAARIDDVLGSAAAASDHAEWVGDERRFAEGILEAGQVDAPLALSPHEVEICRVAWESLSGESSLPEWWDELTTIGEVSRRAGVERGVVKAALDEARSEVGPRFDFAGTAELGLAAERMGDWQPQQEPTQRRFDGWVVTTPMSSPGSYRERWAEGPGDEWTYDRWMSLPSILTGEGPRSDTWSGLTTP